MTLSRSQQLATLSASNHKQKLTAPSLPKPKSWRRAFRSPNSSRFETWVVNIIAEVWLAVDPVHDLESKTVFVELAVMYEINRQELSPDELIVWSEIDYEKIRRLRQFFQKRGTDFIKSVISWALSTSDIPLKDNNNVNIAHAYKWYGTREPQTTTDLQSAIKYYRTALAVKSNSSESTAAIVSSLSVTYMELFSQTLEIKDLSEGIEYSQRAVDLTPPEHPQSPTYIVALCQAFTTRSELENSVDDINKCIEYARKGLTVNGKKIGIQGGLYFVLVTGYVYRYFQTGSEGDLREAVTLLGQSLGVTFSNGNVSSPHGIFDTLRQFYDDNQTTTFLLPTSNSDPFEPLLESAKKQILFANDDIQSMMNIANIPDFSEQIDIVEDIVLSVGFFYKCRNRYDTALQYFQNLLEVTKITSELMMKVGFLSDQLVEEAWLLICIGDTLYMQGKMDEAKGHYRHAREGLDATKNLLGKKKLLARLSNKGWDFKDSHFMEV
jgi:tetratricopeptide (TPR) repeat protein